MQPEYDPERQLWIPGRRSFLFMAGAAVAGLFLPESPKVINGYQTWVSVCGAPPTRINLADALEAQRQVWTFKYPINLSHRATL